MLYTYNQLYLTINDFGYRVARVDYHFPGQEIKLKDNSVNYVFVNISNNTLAISDETYPLNVIKIGVFHTSNNQILDIRNDFIQYTLDTSGGAVGDLYDMFYDNSGSNLTTSNGQDAIDEIQNSNPGIQFDITNTVSAAEGVVNWNSEDKTLQVGMGGGVALQLGQEMFLRAKALDSNILNGQVVYIFGAAGANPTVKLANSSDFNKSCSTIAVATENVNQNSNGYFTTYGFVRDINTNVSGWTEGDILYLDSTDGGLTNVKPTAPNCIVQVGYLLKKSATEGVIFVDIKFDMGQMVNEITREPTGFDEPEGVQYDRLVPLLINEIKFLREKYDNLEKLFMTTNGSLEIKKSLFGKTTVKYVEGE